MMDVFKLPKQEEVEDFDLGDNKITLVELTDGNRPAMLEFAMSMYEGDVCMYCKKDFTKEEVKKSKWAHKNEFGRIVHADCWNNNNP